MGLFRIVQLNIQNLEPDIHLLSCLISTLVEVFHSFPTLDLINHIPLSNTHKYGYNLTWNGFIFTIDRDNNFVSFKSL